MSTKPSWFDWVPTSLVAWVCFFSGMMNANPTLSNLKRGLVLASIHMGFMVVLTVLLRLRHAEK